MRSSSNHTRANAMCITNNSCCIASKLDSKMLHYGSELQLLNHALHYFLLIRWSDWECTRQASAQRSYECSLPQGGRQMEDDWSSPGDSEGNSCRHSREESTRPPHVLHRDAGDLVRTNPPSCLLGHHH